MTIDQPATDRSSGPTGGAVTAGSAVTAPLGTPEQRYRMLRLIRGFEELALGLVRAKVIIGGVHPYIGQEAVAVGVCAALGPGDRLTSTHRGHGHVLARGVDPHRLLAELAGRVDGLNRGRGGSMHAADLSLGILGANGMVGAGAPIAVGAAWAAQQAGDGRVAVAFFGDGALNQGVLLEAFNLAAMWRLPVVFVCENNGYATTLPASTAVAGSALGRARAFGIPAVEVDGMDTEAVRAAAAEAVERARSGGGPGFLECRTYRFEAHHTMEHRMKLHYRAAEEVDAWRTRDPLPRAAALIGEARRSALDEEVAAELAAAERFALASEHPDPAGALDYLYADGLRPRAGASG
ncbi:thiamine pyrophosphate-dependent dehydrogenase E1 component subunit alpha [Kitasatospora sp. NPDC052868]|uniref:thiamine pyrophosphate-dependent dehydrogenase E1 component subunit alpha n=1 Tax=Kitasatospora sp. NPDC052868 TaxID=3364060 RepID=UPI0037CBC0AE